MDHFPPLSRPFLPMKINRLSNSSNDLLSHTSTAPFMPYSSVSMQMAGDNTSKPSSLPLAMYPTSSPQRLASDHERRSLLLKVKQFLRGMGRGAIPNSTNRVTHAEFLGGSGQKRLQSQIGVSRNKTCRYSITYLWLRGQIHLIRMCFSLLIYKW